MLDFPPPLQPGDKAVGNVYMYIVMCTSVSNTLLDIVHLQTAYNAMKLMNIGTCVSLQRQETRFSCDVFTLSVYRHSYQSC